MTMRTSMRTSIHTCHTCRTWMVAGALALLVASAPIRIAFAKHEPPPVVIPTAETAQADQLYRAGRYQDAVAAAKQATSSIPIVFPVAVDPLGSGFVASLARPGGNVTGLSLQGTDVAGKRLQMLREIVPGLRRLAIMANVAYPAAKNELAECQSAARALGLEATLMELRQPEDIATTFDALGGGAEALYVVSDALTNTTYARIASLALSARLPTMFGTTDSINSGGLMAYGPNYPDLYRQTAVYVDKIFKGANPGDLPVEQPTKFELIINLKTAKALGITIPPPLLLRADEVIQ